MKYPLIYLLNNDYETVAVFSNELPQALPVISDYYEGDLDDNSFIVEIETILTHPRASEIKVGNYIYYPTSDDTNKKLFRIVEVKEERSESHIVTLVAELTVIGDLLEQIVRPTSFASGSISEILDMFLLNTEWEYELRGDFPSIDYEIDNYTTTLEAIRELAKTIGAEIDYEYQYNGLTIYSRKIIFYSYKDEDVAAYISRERDLKSIKREIDSRNVVTSLIAVGGTNNLGEKVTLAQLPEDAPIPQGYLHGHMSDYVDSIVGIYSYPTRRFGIFTDSTCLTSQDLLDKSVEKLKELSTPLYKYEVNFSMLDKVDRLALGRTVFINDTTIEPALALSAKIRKIKTSIYSPDTNEVVLGNYVNYDTSLDNTIKDMQDKIRQEEIKNELNSYSVKIDSSSGLSFVNKSGETTLTIKVYRRGLEVDGDGQMFTYIWKRYDENGKEIPINGISGIKEVRQKSIKIIGDNFNDVDKIVMRGTAIIEIGG